MNRDRFIDYMEFAGKDGIAPAQRTWQALWDSLAENPTNEQMRVNVEYTLSYLRYATSKLEEAKRLLSE